MSKYYPREKLSVWMRGSLSSGSTRGCAHKRFSLAKRISLVEALFYSFRLVSLSLCLCVSTRNFSSSFLPQSIFLPRIDRARNAVVIQGKRRRNARREERLCHRHSPSHRAFLIISRTDIFTSLHTGEQKKKTLDIISDLNWGTQYFETKTNLHE